MERVLIFGDRNWQNSELVFTMLRELSLTKNIECVIEGEARGADTHGRLAAERLGIPVIAFPANWTKYGRAAGPIRNQQMLKEGRPTYAMGFHNDIEHSKGTYDMAGRLRKAGIEHDIISEKGVTNGLYR